MGMTTSEYDGVQLRRGAMAMGGAALLAVSPAFAHHPMGGMTPETLGQGLLSGLGHPIIGPDHLAFLVLAVVLSLALKGSARLMVPLAFVAATLGGAILHLGAAHIPMAESLVALSVVVAGVLAVTRRYPGALLLTALFAVSGVFHGYAYAEAIIGAETTPLLAYLAGFAMIQYGLIVGGILVLERLATGSEWARSVTLRIGGAVALTTGGIFLALSLA